MLQKFKVCLREVAPKIPGKNGKILLIEREMEEKNDFFGFY